MGGYMAFDIKIKYTTHRHYRSIYSVPSVSEGLKRNLELYYFSLNMPMKEGTSLDIGTGWGTYPHFLSHYRIINYKSQIFAGCV